MKRQRDEYDCISTSFAPTSCSALDMLVDASHKPVLSLGCPILNNLLAGGLRKGVTEVAGASATGKTQLCLQWALQAQLPLHLGGLDGDVVYISTEGAFPSRRLEQMIAAMRRRHPALAQRDFASRVFVERCASLKAFDDILFRRLPRLLARRNVTVRLLIIDSIAGLFRHEFARDGVGVGDDDDDDDGNNDNGYGGLGIAGAGRDWAGRAELLLQTTARLHLLSGQHSLPIVVVNQVRLAFCVCVCFSATFMHALTHNLTHACAHTRTHIHSRIVLYLPLHPFFLVR
jgi:RecA/RadA recombinase